jgi:ABC-type antimicrobial peptide transport system permease subunit
MIVMPLLQIAHYSSDTDNAYQIWANCIDSVQLRVIGHAEPYEPMVRETLANVNPNLSPTKVVKFEDQISTGFNTERLIACLTGLYALLALVLAAIGLYGVAAYLVIRRTTEIGVRMALGAKRSDVVAMVVCSVMTPILTGLAIGMPAAFAAGRGMASQLFGVKDYDPMVLIAAVAALSLSAFLAAIVPARRAVAIDPLEALRME